MPSPNCVKILKTCNLYLCFIALGMCFAVFGPCLLDLKDLVKTDTKHIGFIYTARSIGFLAGSILGGILLDAIKWKQPVLTFCVSIAAASFLGIPWSRNLGILIGCIVVYSVFHGVVNIGGNVLCLRLWGSKSAPYYQALHFTFGVGGLISPLIAAPFLGNHSSDGINNETSSINSTLSFNFTSEILDTDNITTSPNIPRIVYPFSIIGLYLMIVSVVLLVVSIISPTEVTDQQVEEEGKSENKLGFVVTVVFLYVLLFFSEHCIQLSCSQLLTTYVVKGRLKLTPSTGSYMTSTFWASYTVSRLASVFLAIKLSNLSMLVADLVVQAVGAFILLFLASYEWAIWLSTVLLGAGLASFFASAVGWMDTYITVTNTMVSIFITGSCLSEMVLPYTITYFIDTVPDAFIYIVPSICILDSLIVLLLYLIFKKRQKIFEKPEPTENPKPSGFVVNGAVTEEIVT